MKHILMLCHDQQLDRRVVAQAQTLIDADHRVTIVALSFGAEDEESTMPEGITLFRIGLGRIVPENGIYRGYIERQQACNSFLNAACNQWNMARRLWLAGFRMASKANALFYRASLLTYYRRRRINDPLPFRSAFLSAGLRFPADLVQVHDLPALEAGAELARMWDVPLVYDTHELYPEQKTFSSRQRAICSFAEKRLIRFPDVVFTVNESIAQEMSHRYRIKKPIVMLNAIDPPNSFDPEDRYDLLRVKLRLSQNRKILLFQGGYTPHRNLENLVEAMRFVRNETVDLVFMGFGDFETVLRKKADRAGLLGRRIHFLPAVPQSELLQHSASADIGIIPYPHVDLNSYYCTPNKLFEFIQAGLPILANDSPELRRFVDGENFGLVRPMRSAREIAKAIDDVFSLRPVVWKNALQSKRHRFSWRKQSKMYLSTMDSLLADGAGIGESAHLQRKGECV